MTQYMAAVFLIENLPFHYSYEGESLNDYLKLFELHGKGTMYPDKVLDSIKRACGSFHLDQQEVKSDIYIDQDYLIGNIEWETSQTVIYLTMIQIMLNRIK